MLCNFGARTYLSNLVLVTLFSRACDRKNPQAEQRLTMKPNPTSGRSFRFYTSNGKRLTQQIESIEEMATKSLKAGTAYHSVQTGCLALLKIAMEEVSTQAD